MADQRLTLRLQLENGQFVGQMKVSRRALGDFTGTTQRGERASERYSRATRRVERANLRAAGSFSAAGRTALRYFGVLAGAFTLQRIGRETLEAADAYTELNNRIRLVTDSERNLLEVRAELFDVSQETRTGLEANAALYSKITLAVRQFGRTQDEALRVTALLNQQVRIGGSTASEGAAGLQQFAQGLASGRLQGDELRSVLENLQGVSEGLIVGFGRLREQGRIDFQVTRGNIRELAAEGVLSADLLFDAVLASADDTEAKFADVQSTIADGAVTIRNAFVSAIGQLDQSLGLSAAIARQLERVAAAIDRGSRPTIISPDDVAFVEQMTGSINQLDSTYRQFLRTVRASDLDEQTIETQLAIARSALERFSSADILPGMVGSEARSLAQSTIERLTGLSRENIQATLANTRQQIQDEGRRLERQLEENRARGIDESDLRAQPLFAGENAPESIRRQIRALREELAEAETVARQFLDTELQVRARRIEIEAPEGDDAGDAQTEFERLRRRYLTPLEAIADARNRALDVIFADEGATAEEREALTLRVLENAARQRAELQRRELEDEQEKLDALQEIVVDAGARREAFAERQAQRELVRLRNARTQELTEAQGFNNQGELEEVRHQQALIAILNRHGNQEQTRLLQDQHDAQQALEKGNQRATAQIVLGNLQSTLGALGRYNQRAFRLAQAAGIAKAVIDTQQAITQALTQPPPLSFVYAGLAAAQGAAAIATIRSQRPPQAFQRGGIVDSPTFFSARNVPRGVAGEAGPEAILPLRRGRDGRLGVEVSASRQTIVHFSPRLAVTVQGGGDPESNARAGRELAVVVERQFEALVAKHQRPGGLFNSLSVA